MVRREYFFTSAPREYDSLESSLQSGPRSGTANVRYTNNFPLNFYFHDKGAETTIVTFHGALPDTPVDRLPFWAGYGITQSIPANLLFFSDPSLYLDTRLKPSWFTGNTLQPNLQTDITKIIHHLCQGKRIILFGASGGGFAALEQATKLKGCTALVSNLQTDIFEYHSEYYSDYLAIA